MAIGGNRMYIIGASTLGEIALEVIVRSGANDILGFYDDISSKNSFCGKPILGKLEALYSNPDAVKQGVFIAIGDNSNRNKIYEKMKEMNIPLVNVIDPTAVVEQNCSIGVGNLIMANSYIGVQTKIGDCNLIFPGVSITHHNVVGDCNFFAPNVSVGGYTQIKNECKFGLNSGVAPYIHLDSETHTQPCSFYTTPE